MPEQHDAGSPRTPPAQRLAEYGLAKYGRKENPGREGYRESDGFVLRDAPDRAAQVLDRLTADGTAFLTPTTVDGTPGIRAAVCNWRTTDADVDRAWDALVRCAQV